MKILAILMVVFIPMKISAIEILTTTKDIKKFSAGSGAKLEIADINGGTPI